MLPPDLRASSFGKNFHWGVALSAAQNEGAVTEDGRSLSIWDQFAKRKAVIKKEQDQLLPVISITGTEMI